MLRAAHVIPSRLLAIVLTGSVAVAPSPAQAAEPASKASDEAQDLFHEGSARFSAADYEGAIEKFTQALAVASKEGLPFRTRGAFLINLARSHTRAERVNGDIIHLRAATEIYERYLREAEQAGENALDTVEVQRELDEVRALLEEREAEQAAAAAAEPDPVEPTAEPAAQATPTGDEPPSDQFLRRPASITLLSTGAVLAAAGIAGIGWGATFGPHAEDQIAPEDQGTSGADDFLERERRKGAILMGVGGALTAVGIAGIVVGAIGLARNNEKTRRVDVATQGLGARLAVRF